MIMDSSQLPFKVGQQAESKSFLAGFRSAWFRCKIKNISCRRGQIGHSLEFFDFPGEKVSLTKLYQKPPHIVSHEESKMELMVRPSFPPFYREGQLPDSYPVADVIVIVSETWKVGDLVDWWSDHCYWSGRVIELLGNDKVKVELPEPPIGEGKSYAAFCEDLRPSLDWSPENGWTIPVSKKNGDCWYSARLIRPHNKDNESEVKHAQAGSTTDTERIDMSTDLKSGSPREEKTNCLYEASKSNDEVKDAADPERIDMSLDLKSGSPREEKTNCLYEASKSNDEVKDAADPERIDMSLDLKSGSPREEKTNCLYEVSKSQDEVKDAAVDHTKISCEKDIYSSVDSIEEKQISESKYMKSRRRPDTIESSIVELEELANKIRWLKGLLQFGFRWSNAMKPSWRFLENYGSYKNR